MLNPFVGHGEEDSDIEPLEVDGIVGPKTEDAVKRFQRFSEGPPLAVDGIVGQKTWTSC
jgi:peptidoglycan hydrolase-like protein with peptidoglycan-binding domain